MRRVHQHVNEKVRSVLRSSNIIEVKKSTSIDNCRSGSIDTNVQITTKVYLVMYFCNEERVTIHPTLGTPQLYFDQLNIIAKHLYECKIYFEVLSESDYILPAIYRVKKNKGGMSQFTRT